MADTISQDEINSLFSQAAEGNLPEANDGNANETSNLLSASDKDVLGEVGNISMGSAATTLSSILNEKVNITTPTVKEGSTLKELFSGEEKYVAIDIKYKTGLDGSFMLIIKESDIKIIANMMMGKGPEVDPDSELGDLEVSAIAEAMNQMVGTSCTSMSQVFDSVVDINPPSVEKVDTQTSQIVAGVDINSGDYVTVEFDLNVGDILASKMIQILPSNVAKQLIDKLMSANGGAQEDTSSQQNEIVESEPVIAETATEEVMTSNVNVAATTSVMEPAQSAASMKAQAVQFEELAAQRVENVKEQISLIQDVPLEVVVELGRTNKSIKEILEFSPGVVIELNKMAGEPIDILINNKFIAKGEVVVIDENFGIRITEIIDVKKRI